MAVKFISFLYDIVYFVKLSLYSNKNPNNFHDIAFIEIWIFINTRSPVI